MKKTARLYHCVRCQSQVLLCSVCDRGNIYCSPDCAKPARKESQTLACSRYQKSYRGRLNHAARQQRYRTRQKEKVTHHGSPPISGKSLSHPPEKPTEQQLTPITVSQHCHFCRQRISDLLRMGFIHRSGSRRSVLTSTGAQDP